MEVPAPFEKKISRWSVVHSYYFEEIANDGYSYIIGQKTAQNCVDSASSGEECVDYESFLTADDSAKQLDY
jgi:hypothetical protein